MISNPGQVEFGVRSTFVLSRTLTKNYIYITEMSVCPSVWRERQGGWTGRRGAMGRGDFTDGYDGMPGWT